MLIGIYNRIQTQEFRAGVDHVTQVMKVEQTVVGKKPVSVYMYLCPREVSIIVYMCMCP